MGTAAFVLDFLWKLLIVVTLGSTFIFSAFQIARLFFGKVSAKFFNRLARVSSASLLGLICIAGVVLSIADKDLQARCFGSFVELQGGFGITRVLGLLWLLGVVILLVLDGLKIRLFSQHLKQFVLKEESDYLLVSNRIPAMTYGIFRPQIVIPQAVASDLTRLKCILLHEKTHIKNNDGMWSFIALVVLRICWFSPLSFLFEKNRILAMELATDEETISVNDLNSFTYAESLISVLEIGSLRTNNQMQISAVSHFAQLKFRIEQMRPGLKMERCSFYKWVVLSLMMFGWMMGVREALASIRISKPTVASEVMCYQVQHEKIIENWFHMKKEANKCE